jgi:histidine ammonia-lyase
MRIQIGPDHKLTLQRFFEAFDPSNTLQLSQESIERLQVTRRFIQHLLETKTKIYGLTTGFADMRDKVVDPKSAAELSLNLIKSHDAGIGTPISSSIVLGAMILRANSLAKGHSGFCVESLQTLLQMICNRIIPEIPCTGSLGASGDLAFLARLGMAMCGEDVLVDCAGERMTAREALKKYTIEPFKPSAKEGLALTNGTAFMAASLAMSYRKAEQLFKRTINLMGLFLNAVKATPGAFSDCLQKVRGHKGQSEIAAQLSQRLCNSPFADCAKTQDDYCIRCLPQLLGPKWDLIQSFRNAVEIELDAVTDNPLFFYGAELSDNIPKENRYVFDKQEWAVLSGGNFHGEVISTICDSIVAAQAKIALILERQITYMLNPNRNKGVLPIYLIPEQTDQGLHSGYIITQYTANALAHKICLLAAPVQPFNITSGNESEDVVSYGATAAERLQEQLEFMNQLLSIYATVVMQAYSLQREKVSEKIRKGCWSEVFFKQELERNGLDYPFLYDAPFAARYGANGVYS